MSKRTTRTPEREAARRAAPPADAANDPHYEEQGTTAEDDDGVGQGEEGFRAEDYPGQNPVRGEDPRGLERRRTYTWTWPQVSPEVDDDWGGAERADRAVCRAIGRRILLAEPDLKGVVVHVRDGAVRMEGTVASHADKRTVEGLAEHVDGVRRLESRIAVEE